MNLSFYIFSNKQYKVDLLVVGLIISAPLLFYLYRLLPNNTNVWVTKWFTFTSDYFDDIEYFAWILFVKILTISILSLWYISCTNSWRNILFVPIVFEFYKLFTSIYAEIFNILSILEPFLSALFFSVPFILFLIIIAQKTDYYKSSREISKKLNTEINENIEKLSKFNIKNYMSIKKEMSVLVKQKNKIPKKEYLAKLIALRDRLTLD